MDTPAMLTESRDRKSPATGTEILASAGSRASALPATEVEAASGYARAEKAPATRRAYRSDFRLFRAWCSDRGADALPAAPETVATFLAFEATHRVKPSTISRRLAAIRFAHKLAA
jgi:hypothetical protein